MDIVWAIEQMRAGKDVRRAVWVEEARYISMKDAEHLDTLLSVRDMLSTDWELV